MENETNALEPVVLIFEDVKLTCPIESGHRMIPVKMVCTIIDVDFKTQDSWLKEHPFLSQLYRLWPTVGADGKQRDMNCLSILDIPFWIGSLSLSNRKPGSIERQYRFMAWLRERMMEFYKSIDVWIQENKYEQQLIELKEQTEEQLLRAKQTVKELSGKLREIDVTIEDIRLHRFTGQTALPFPEQE